ncbi:hypothetical protein AXFE_17110 [Acidithrix ferrooxidans]|uniref:Uncharacterized protein n=1 Tax=Acidithrix ferrooxidans TaxID=1280514 RepID=A0A0D8HHP5_9ACTN|nr:hypothetical protein AXFE_17110 [Acidithrix ferrooxidans]
MITMTQIALHNHDSNPLQERPQGSRCSPAKPTTLRHLLGNPLTEVVKPLQQRIVSTNKGGPI